MGRTALVHPNTAKLTPEEQQKGVYVFTPPEVLAYINGESLNETDLELVRSYYGGKLPNNAPPDVQHEIPSAPAVASGFDYQPQRKAELSPAIAAPFGKKLVKKKQSGATPLDAAYVLVAALDDDAAYSLLCHLAGRFDLSIE